MEATELRIGNMFATNYSSEIYSLEYISLGSEYIFHIKGVNEYVKESSLMPVLLTEEWLVRFGGKWHGDFITLKMVALQLNSCLPNMQGATFALYCGSIFIKEVRFVHELQNLYFVLTGEELQC